MRFQACQVGEFRTFGSPPTLLAGDMWPCGPVSGPESASTGHQGSLTEMGVGVSEGRAS